MHNGEKDMSKKGEEKRIMSEMQERNHRLVSHRRTKEKIKGARAR